MLCTIQEKKKWVQIRSASFIIRQFHFLIHDWMVRTVRSWYAIIVNYAHAQIVELFFIGSPLHLIVERKIPIIRFFLAYQEPALPK